MSDPLNERVARLEANHEHLHLKLDDIHRDVKSLLASRSYARGMWRMVIVTASAVSAAVSLAIAWLKGTP